MEPALAKACRRKIRASSASQATRIFWAQETARVWAWAWAWVCCAALCFRTHSDCAHVWVVLPGGLLLAFAIAAGLVRKGRFLGGRAALALLLPEKPAQHDAPCTVCLTVCLPTSADRAAPPARRTQESPNRHLLSAAACVDDHRIATILLRSPWRPVACPQPYEPYTFLKALFETRSKSLCTCPGDEETTVQVRSRARLQTAPGHSNTRHPRPRLWRPCMRACAATQAGALYYAPHTHGRHHAPPHRTDRGCRVAAANRTRRPT